MERLTKKEYFTWDEDGTKNLTYIEKLQNKLGAFEDFMEENGFESLKDLQTHINKINKYELCIRKQFVKEINEEDFFDMKEENQALKKRWQKLKEWFEHKEWDMPTSRDRALKKMQELEKEIK